MLFGARFLSVRIRGVAVWSGRGGVHSDVLHVVVGVGARNVALRDALDRERIPGNRHRLRFALSPYPQVQFGDGPPERLSGKKVDGCQRPSPSAARWIAVLTVCQAKGKARQFRTSKTASSFLTSPAHRELWSAVTSAAATAPTSTVDGDGKRARAIAESVLRRVKERRKRHATAQLVNLSSDASAKSVRSTEAGESPDGR